MTATDKHFRLNLNLEGYPCTAELSVPSQAVTLTEFLPLVWKLQDGLIGVWERLNAAEGRAVSCRAGCGACCRQLVPISLIETWHIRQTVAAMPMAARLTIQARFEQAREVLAERGLLDRLGQLTALSLEEKRQLGIEYFAAGLPCPFLEQESCSIHAVRPSACREYLVTSPAIHCSDLDGGKIAMLNHAAKFSSILFRFADGGGAAQPVIIPLSLALAVEGMDDTQASQAFHAPVLFENFLRALAVLFERVA